MAINTNYRELTCYTALPADTRTLLDRLIQSYGQDMNQAVDIGPSLYTPHDFNHHCYNLYRIISQSLCNIDASGQNSLTAHELLLLDIAVLFHDYAMSKKIQLRPDRATHAWNSAQEFLEEWENTSSALYKEGQSANLSDNDITAVSEIIKAHSDDKTINSAQTGIHATSLGVTMPSSAPKPVRARLLAGILRIADELDITKDRLGDIRLERQLDLSDPDSAFSWERWDRLRYFSEIKVDRDIRDQLDLVVDDREVKARIESGDGDTVLESIWDTDRKIQHEWAEIQEHIFVREDNARAMIRVQKICVVSGLDEVNQYLKRMQEDRQSLTFAPSQGARLSRLETPSDFPVAQMDVGVDQMDMPSSEGTHPQREGPPPAGQATTPFPEIQTALDDLVRRKQLVRPGHFYLNETFCARDWINTEALIEDTALFKQCIQAMAQHIKAKMNLENTIILGINLFGTLLGIRIAAALHAPFAFLVPAKEVLYSGSPDNVIDHAAFDHAICITDAVVTGTTLSGVIDRCKLWDKVRGAYTLLYRRPKQGSIIIPPAFPVPLYCISDTFEIEVVKAEDCSWKGSIGCIARNTVVK